VILHFDGLIATDLQLRLGRWGAGKNYRITEVDVATPSSLGRTFITIPNQENVSYRSPPSHELPHPPTIRPPFVESSLVWAHNMESAMQEPVRSWS
jgi:hypothetical protein